MGLFLSFSCRPRGAGMAGSIKAPFAATWSAEAKTIARERQSAHGTSHLGSIVTRLPGAIALRAVPGLGCGRD